MNRNRKGKKVKIEEPKVLGVGAIEDGLMDMVRAIETGGPWIHPEMKRIPEWRGAGVGWHPSLLTTFNRRSTPWSIHSQSTVNATT